jgi:hypothetical protein
MICTVIRQGDSLKVLLKTDRSRDSKIYCFPCINSHINALVTALQLLIVTSLQLLSAKDIAVELQPYGRKNRRAVVPPMHKT